MRKNKVALEQGFAETAPSWAKLAAYLGDHGILDGDGKRPTGESTRQAWYRARTMPDASKPAPAVPAPAYPAAHPVPVSAVRDEDNDARPERPRFTFAALRNHTPAVPPPEPAAPVEAAKADVSVERDIDAEIQQRLGIKPRKGFQPPDGED